MTAGFLVFSIRLFDLRDDGTVGGQGYLVEVDFGGDVAAACGYYTTFLAY
jgi:hypothetical protein